jgi:hypothetical protein
LSNKITDIHFRLLEEEKEVIAEAAKVAGKSLSDYARDILLAASDYEVTDITYAHKTRLQQADTGRKKDIHIRISEEELAFYLEQAEKAGCTVSEYIRRSANRNEIYVIPGLKELARQIAKLGVNINQLTVLARMGKIKEVDLYPANDTLKQILKQLVGLSRQRKE